MYFYIDKNLCSLSVVLYVQYLIQYRHLKLPVKTIVDIYFFSLLEIFTTGS